MGYLTLPGGIPNFSKAVFSVWFRIPAAVKAAALAEAVNWWEVTEGPVGGLSSTFTQGIIPLITFGPNTETMSTDGSESGAVMPCCIGLSCRDETTASLFVRLQYNTGNQGSAGVTSPAFINDFFAVGFPPFPTIGVGFGHVSGSPFTVPVVADQWHHLLVSFDLSGGCAVTVGGSSISFGATCPFYWALDDVNYNGKYLGPNAPGEFEQTPDNGIASFWSMNNSSFAGGNLPTSGFPLGIPASGGFSDHIYKIQMAELQLFTGVTMDTGIVANRRAFITSALGPAKPSLAQALLLQAPDILLHGSNNWITGANTGSLGTTFDHTGTVTAYTPDP